MATKTFVFGASMTGDTLTIAALIWGAAITLSVAMLQAVQAKNKGWAAGYFFGAMLLFIAGFFWEDMAHLTAKIVTHAHEKLLIVSDIIVYIDASRCFGIATFGFAIIYSLFVSYI
jgi:hypothetical protein